MLLEMLRQARENIKLRRAERGEASLDITPALGALVNRSRDCPRNRAQQMDPRRNIRLGSISFGAVNRRYHGEEE